MAAATSQATKTPRQGGANRSSDPPCRFLRGYENRLRERLGQLIRSAYPWAWSLPAGTSLEGFREELRSRCDLTGETLHLAASFVTAAARDLSLDLPIEPVKRGRRPKRAHSTAAQRAGSSNGSRTDAQRSDYVDILLSIAKASAATGSVDPKILDRIEFVLRIDKRS